MPTQSGALGNYFQGKLITSGITVNATSTMAGTAASNVLIWQHPQRFWRALTTASEQILTFDMNPVPAGGYAALHIRGVNTALCYVQANATNTWGSPTFTQLNVPLDLDPLLLAGGEARRARLLFFNADHTSISLRFVRIGFPALQPTDDGSPYCVEVVSFLNSTVEVESRRPIRKQRISYTGKNPMPQGAVEKLKLGRDRIALSMPWKFFLNTMAGAVNNEEAAMVVMAVNEIDPLVICPDLNRLHLSYLMRREGAIDWTSEDVVGADFPLDFMEI